MTTDKTHLPELQYDELERLAILAEECAEVIQVVGKIVRHGFDSYNPNDSDRTRNRQLLETELGHVQYAIRMMNSQGAGDVSTSAIIESQKKKAVSIKKYLHHQL